MKLSRFITQCKQQILSEWEQFARTLAPAAGDMTDLALRDHASQILDAAAKDIVTAQSDAQQEQKAKGRGPAKSRKSAASIHGEIRHVDGFSLDQLLAEYRALRSTVLRLWADHNNKAGAAAAYEVLRFNEFIDQAVAESAASFSERSSAARELFLAILGHDLRGPLSTMALSGEILSRDNLTPAALAMCGAQITRSTVVMTAMVNDLLEYSRTQLGVTIPVSKEFGDLRVVCEASLEDARAGHRDCPFEFNVSGNTIGEFDHVRMQQVFTNLLNNAAQHGCKESPVTLDAVGEGDTLSVFIRNHGPPIPPDAMKSMFEPLVRLSSIDDSRQGSSLGLGLFVARNITLNHGGKISLKSTLEDGTVFTVSIPRK